MGLALGEDPSRHIVLLNDGAYFALSKKQFFNNISIDANTSIKSTQQVLIFVHGYNMGFEDSVRRTAQLASDLVFKGAAVAFSWPSRGLLYGYLPDVQSATWAGEHLADLITDLRSAGIHNVFIISHSMVLKLLLKQRASSRLGEAIWLPWQRPMLIEVSSCSEQKLSAAYLRGQRCTRLRKIALWRYRS